MLLKARGLECREQADLQGQREKTVLWRFSLKEPPWCLSVHTAGGKRRCCGEVIDPALRFFVSNGKPVSQTQVSSPSWLCRFNHVTHSL